jgi:cyclic pyranopterin phosphate synthase
MKMVDVSQKTVSSRVARASGTIRLKPSTVEMIRSGAVEKGDPLSAAQLAGLLAAKRTWELIPMCHHIPLGSVEVQCELQGDRVVVYSTVKAVYKTGVEMEALTACFVALLTIWDMVKQYEKDELGQYPRTKIEGLAIIEKEKKRVDRK